MSRESAEKGMRIVLVRKKTEALILEHGFIYDGATFNLDTASIQKWLALRAMQAELTWPVEVSPRVGSYSLTEANLSAFLMAGMAVVQGYKDSGRALRLQLEAATTMSEMIDIVDDRT
jgi:hypothetical protein